MEPIKLGSAAPRRGNALTRGLGRGMLCLLRWRVVGALPSLPQFVIIVAPHTSNWDFIVGIAARLALDLDVYWLGKQSLFRGPLAPLLTWLHGIPVDRSAPQGLIRCLSGRFREGRPFVLALAPEGTRSKVTRWKSGFYFVALQANVPVVPVAFDYKLRMLRILSPFWPTGRLDEDLAFLREGFRQVTPRHPERYE